MGTACAWYGNGVAFAEALALSFVLTFGIGLIAASYSAGARDIIIELFDDEGEGDPAAATRGALAAR